jgi:hypothetical protein
MSEEIMDLRGYVNDMLAVETEFHASLRRQKDDRQIRESAEAHEIIATAENVVDAHIASLKECLARIGGDESVVKKAVGTVLGAAAGVYNQVRSAESASRALRDDYTALCFGSVCYEMLHTTALAMNEGRTASVAIKNLKDFPPIILAISQLMPSVLVKELADERKVRPDASIAALAARNTRAAWSEASPAM